MEHVEPTAQFWYSQSFLVRRKRSFVSKSSERQTKYGRSSYRLVRKQRMMAKENPATKFSAHNNEKIERAKKTLPDYTIMCFPLPR